MPSLDMAPDVCIPCAHGRISGPYEGDTMTRKDYIRIAEGIEWGYEGYLRATADQLTFTERATAVQAVRSVTYSLGIELQRENVRFDIRKFAAAALCHPDFNAGA